MRIWRTFFFSECMVQQQMGQTSSTTPLKQVLSVSCGLYCDSKVMQQTVPHSRVDH